MSTTNIHPSPSRLMLPLAITHHPSLVETLRLSADRLLVVRGEALRRSLEKVPRPCNTQSERGEHRRRRPWTDQHEMDRCGRRNPRCTRSAAARTFLKLFCHEHPKARVCLTDVGTTRETLASTSRDRLGATATESGRMRVPEAVANTSSCHWRSPSQPLTRGPSCRDGVASGGSRRRRVARGRSVDHQVVNARRRFSQKRCHADASATVSTSRRRS